MTNTPPAASISNAAERLAAELRNGHHAMLATVHIEPSRRADVDARQAELSRVLAHAGCDWCLLLDLANIRWMTAGMNIGDWFPPAEQPVIFSNLINRSVVCASLDTQAIFDTELDELGFSVKEYPWNVDRDRYLEQLIHNRKVACDKAFRDCVPIGGTLRQLRGPLSPYEQIHFRELGQLLSHALEATGRNIAAGETEAEIAGQLGHRMLKRGLMPVSVNILADDRSRQHKRGLPTERRIVKRCLIQATATRDGLFASGSRTVCFGQPEAEFKETYDQGCRLQTILRSKARPGDSVKAALRIGQSFLLDTPYEHEWRRNSFGCRIGRSSMEGRLQHTGSAELFLAGQPVCWETSLHAVRIVETVLPHGDREEPVTGPQEWPIRRVRLPDMTIALPDYLVV